MLLLACATRASPFLDDDRFLRFGTDPDAEARATIAHFEARGHHLYRRERGRHFVALAFADRAGRPTAVRVLTAVGVALSFDSGVPDGALDGALDDGRFEYGLMRSPRAPDADADGDGFEELFIRRTQLVSRAGGGPSPRADAAPPQACIAAFRVRDVGFVDPVMADFGPLGEGACIAALRDVDGDGRTELLARFELPAPPAGRAPVLLCPLWPSQHRFDWRGEPAAMAGYYGGRIERRLARLARADVATDPPTALQLAAELGLAKYMLHGPEAALSAVDAALSGQPLGAAQAAWLRRVRARLSQRRPGDEVTAGEGAAPGAPDAGLADVVAPPEG